MLVCTNAIYERLITRGLKKLIKNLCEIVLMLVFLDTKFLDKKSIIA